MPIKVIEPEDLPKIFENPNDPIHRQNIYVCFIEQKHMVTHLENPESFDKTDYYAHPTKYQATFHKKYLPYISVIFNCMYWDHRFPRLIDDEQMMCLCAQNKDRLIGNRFFEWNNI
jgi:alpha-aminoadipic semialdehyde synthase